MTQEQALKIAKHFYQFLYTEEEANFQDINKSDDGVFTFLYKPVIPAEEWGKPLHEIVINPTENIISESIRVDHKYKVDEFQKEPCPLYFMEVGDRFRFEWCGTIYTYEGNAHTKHEVNHFVSCDGGKTIDISDEVIIFPL